MNIEPKYVMLDGNEAVARVAYLLSEVHAIYPITPSSSMGEHADEWAAKDQKNLFGQIPTVIEMQSEAGACATLHGAIQTGALATTYTASQGLLLMIPNMYKIAGELTPTVIHVAARSLACQGLSIFGDHSDVMAVRNTGFAMLCSSTVQEAQDFAAVAHLATLEARIPFLHFFDGFRTSHEVNKIEILTEDQLSAMIDHQLILEHRKRALDSEHPVIRGTAQNPDVYFQARETVNPFYIKVPSILNKHLQKFAEKTGRSYQLVEYYGHPEAERVVIIMGSGAATVKETVECLVKQEKAKVGILKINLYRPFPMQEFLQALPKTVKSLAVLDRTKEPGAIGEPLYQDVVTALGEALIAGTLSMATFPKVIGGRYGLSSKEFTPAMVKAIFDEQNKPQPKNHFTIGIKDDVTNTSLNFDEGTNFEPDDVVRAIFYGLGADGTVGANKNSIKIIGEGTDFFAQGYFVYDSKKSGSRTISHLRFGPRPINSPYLIQSANFIAVHQFNFVEKIDVLKYAKSGATLLINSPYPADQTWEHLPKETQQKILDKNLEFYVIDAYHVAQGAGMGTRINTVMQACFFALSKVLPRDEAIAKIKEYIRKTYLKKGEDVVKKNFAAVDKTLENLHKVTIPQQVSANAQNMPEVVSSKAPEFVQKVTAMMMADRGDELPVSALPNDGTYPCGTTKWEKRNVSLYVPSWDPEVCIQCGQCSMICPHSVIRVKQYPKELLKNAPEHFKSAPLKGKDNSQAYTLQVYLEDCTGCALCNQVCPAKNKDKVGAKAINMVHQQQILEQERRNIDFFETIPYPERSELNFNLANGVQYLEPLFEFSGACAGCGETPYVKLVSQLFGDRMLIANATGCSSIYGGNLPTTPWTCDQNGRGPAWCNSLFEDNAEFGLGFRVTIDQHREQAKNLLISLAKDLGEELVKDLIANMESSEEKIIAEQRNRINFLKSKLTTLTKFEAQQLLIMIDYIIPRSVWLMGGDGWAYDIGYGGLDHVLASGKNVNALVLNTEVYSNTGGQASKATPLGAVAKFATSGKHTPSKDLGLMAMSYGYVYVAQIAFGASLVQALKAIKEAEAYPGPSLIIAYSHCIAHGINMRLGLNQQKLAVNSGYWLLYRYNPERTKQGLNPLVIDSKEPTVPLREYLLNENRFKALQQTNLAEAEKLFNQAQEEIDRKWNKYQKMAKD